MRASRRVIIMLIMVWGAACAPRQIMPVAVIDPAPLLETVNARRQALERGLSGSMELAFKNRKQRFKGRVYVVAYPDGRFRLEVPAPLGGTHLVMASDNTEILVFYPGENRAFRTSVDGRSLNPHLPFPLPVDPTILPALIMGVYPEGRAALNAQARLMDSGEKLLITGPEGPGLQFTYLFDKIPENPLREITVRGRNMKVSVRTRREPDHLPRDFELTMAEGVLKGEWDSVAPYGGDEAALGLNLPDSVPVTDLEAFP